MIFTLLSSGRKNFWEGNEQVNQMFNNTLKKKKNHTQNWGSLS